MDKGNDAAILMASLKANTRNTFENMTEDAQALLRYMDQKGKVQALVNNKWYLKTNCSFAHNGIYRVVS